MKRILFFILLALCLPAFAVDAVLIGSTTGTQGDTNIKPVIVGANGALWVSEIPTGTVVTGASGNVANGNAVATLAGASGKTTAITGFLCTATGSTSVSVVNITVVGLIGGTATYTFVFPAGVTTAAAPVGVQFTKPIPASATNTAIVVTLPAGGTGNTNAACAAQGFQYL